MTNKTAVELLVEQLQEHIRQSAHNELGTRRTGDYRIGLNKAIDFCEHALEIEKENIINAATWGALHESGEKYYNETYGK